MDSNILLQKLREHLNHMLYLDELNIQTESLYDTHCVICWEQNNGTI